ncbi:restriction endonuclease subunit S [Enterococcus faecalis]|uniref:restriction endonuclease subunit S n=1 Tax=Enterococcus faecalis TaxID=1351 RepID=UPI000C307F1D|nr:restriction endonuclease subunit S [Enterococcus faecalis]EGO7840153.1 restriction endonuclease subunit S [Enterococcus faecalis]EIZ1604554.1 restriction endonuclease subunit S [Enterococcus faecalis]MDN3106679.1 restriction endonuclease subunit S [Enterococcus faecalis]MDN3162791.1 restriction endonuclease subunit S [Enterococcus faecalis]MDU2546852.1 restriction endonuclease subunit S [Enterococcus faecalis]
MKKVPRLRFRGFSEEWELCKFKGLLDEQDGIRRGPFGSALKKAFFVENSEYVVYEQQNAIYDTYETRYKISKEKFKELEKFSISEGDFIMSGAGTIGRISRVPKGVAKGVFNQALIRFRTNTEVTDSEYFIQFVRADKMQKKLTGANPGSAITNLVPMSEIKKWDILIPSKKEQILVGLFLKKLDNTITLHQRKLEQLKELKKAYLQAMFVPTNVQNNKVPKLRFANFEGNWELCKLENVIDKQIKGKVKVENLCNGSVEYLDANRLNGGKPIYTKALPDVSERDIIILWDGSKAGKVYYGFKGVLGSTLKAYQLKECANSQFIYQQLLDNQNNIYNNYRTPNIPHVVKNFSSIFPIWMTSFEEQSQMADILSNLDNRIILQQNLTDTMISLKKSYLQNMFI